MEFIAIVRKSGSSLIITIPKEIAAKFNIKEGQSEIVEIKER